MATEEAMTFAVFYLFACYAYILDKTRPHNESESFWLAGFLTVLTLGIGEIAR